MNTKQLSLACILTLAAGLPRAAAQDAPPVAEIVQKANYTSYYQGRDGRAGVTMTITDAQGRERVREFVILRRDSQPDDAQDESFTGDQKFYVYFRRPADVNRMVFMVWKSVERDDDRWLYMPALDNVRRIAAADKRTSFVGSDFYYEDVSGRNPDEDNHALKQVTEHYYMLESTPKNPDSVEFSRYETWIVKGNFLPTKTTYFDKNGEPYREYTVEQVETIDDFPTVVKARMKDLRTGGHTLIEYRDVKYNVGLPEDIFTERFLRRPPRQHIR